MRRLYIIKERLFLWNALDYVRRIAVLTLQPLMRTPGCTEHCIFLLFGWLQPARLRLSQNCIFQSNCMWIEFTALHFHWPFSPRRAIKVAWGEKSCFLVVFIWCVADSSPGWNEGEMASISHWEAFILFRLFASSNKDALYDSESFNVVGKHPVFLQNAPTPCCTKKILFECPQKWADRCSTPSFLSSVWLWNMSRVPSGLSLLRLQLYCVLHL